jgi:hypothetical protein
MVKSIYTLWLFVLAMAIDAYAFMPNSQKTERRPAFSAAPVIDASNNKNLQSDHAALPTVGPSPASAMFALPPSAMVATLSAAYFEEDEEPSDVSYGVALVSCVLSLALGFGIGYGV